MAQYSGSCHCGALRFQVDAELAGLEVCNCSICRRSGFIHWYVEPEQFRLLGSDETLTTYQFGTRTALNHFCRVCGIAAYRRARSDPNKVDVNARCLDGIDLDSLEIRHFDGVNWEQGLASR